jgi:hypothetical protein
MKRFALLLAAAFLLLAGVALAVSVRDRDDVTHGLDISKAGGAHNRSADQLVHVIDTYEGWTVKSLLNKDRPPSSICIEIWSRSEPGDAPSDYEVCATPDKSGRKLRASVSREAEAGPIVRVAAAKAEHPNSTRIVLRFDPDDIKRPSSYRWRVEATSFARSCRLGSGCPDFTPDRPDTAETRVSAGR